MLGGGVPGLPSLPILLAGVPGAPPNPPLRGVLSGASVLHIEVDAVASSNGAAISSYEIQLDDGLGGAFVSLQGGVAPSMSLQAVKGQGVF